MQLRMSSNSQPALRRQATHRLWTGLLLLALLAAALPVAAAPATAPTAAPLAPAAVTTQPLPIDVLTKLEASDGAGFDKFGTSVAISGDTVIVGAPRDDDRGSDSGSAYVFVRNGGWTQQAKLTASDGAANDNFGTSVAISGDTVIIGSPLDDDLGNNSGSAYVFVRSGTIWTQQQKLVASDGAAGDGFGDKVAIAGDTALVGAYRDDDMGTDSGSAYVFVRSGTTWTQQQKLTASNGAAGDRFGYSVAIAGAADDATAVVGAQADSTPVGTYSGSAYVFVRSGAAWTQQAHLIASDGRTSHYCGYSVAIAGTGDGATALVGCPFDGDVGENAGTAYVYVRSGTTWMEQTKLSPNVGGGFFGTSASVSTDADGPTAYVGAERDGSEGYTYGGASYVIPFGGAAWTRQRKLSIPRSLGGSDWFGNSVAIDGHTTLVGEVGDGTGYEKGSAYVWPSSERMRLWLDLNGDGLPDAAENDYTGPMDVLAYTAGTGRLLYTQAAPGSPIQSITNQFDLGFRVPIAASWSTGAAGTGLQAVNAGSANTYDFGIVPWTNPNTIAGIVYDDYDADGVFDFANWSSDRYLPEPGVAGVTVTAYAPGSTTPAASAVTDAAGRYQLDLAASGATTYRLELTDLPVGYSPSVWGADDPTTVAFAGKNSNVNFGVYEPASYRGAVRLATTRTDEVNNELYRFDYMTDRVGTVPAPSIAIGEQGTLGNTFGLAWQTSSDTLFASPFFGGLGTGYGSGGSGGIYQVENAYDRTDGGGALFVNLDDYGIDTGPDDVGACVITGQAGAGCFHDIGSRGLGDLDLSPDGSMLYVVSPRNDQVVRVAIGNPPTAPTSVDAFTVPRPTSTCTDNWDFMPFALGVAPNGTVYVGATCIGRSTQSNNNLRGYVYEWDPTGAFPTAPVLDFPLYYPRKKTTWRTWAPLTDIYARTGSPLLADIGIDFDRGDLILTIADIYGYGTGLGGGGGWVGFNGDILRACYYQSAWALENSGACGTTVVHPMGAANNDGPGNGEYYWQDDALDNGTDTANGSSSTLPNFRHVAFNGVDIRSSGYWHGAGYLDQRTGARSNVVSDILTHVSSSAQGKTALLGDLEPLWAPPVSEVGNRIWHDADGDGIQDADEVGIDGVTVGIYCGGNQIGQATTANGGQYTFGGVHERSMLPVGAKTRTVTVVVGPDSDDADEVLSSGAIYLAKDRLYAPYDNSPALRLAGVRFNGMSIPRGATITNATIEFTFIPGGGAVNLTIKGQAADSPETFTLIPGDISSRSTTTAGVNWTANVTSQAVTSIVQEIVNRPAWEIGNSMVFVVMDNGTTSPNRRQLVANGRNSYLDDYGIRKGSAVLTVSYSEPYSVPADSACEVRVPTGQAALSGLGLTTANAPQPANGNASATDNHPISDVADSDASLSGANAVIAFTTGGTGQNNHGLDFGFEPLAPADWGDLPDPPYLTLSANNGPSHGVVSTLYLGACVDAEANGQPSLAATGDDLGAGSLTYGTCTSPNDDEDGVTLVTPLVAGREACISATAVSSAASLLNGWIDFDGNGSLADASDALSFTKVNGAAITPNTDGPVAAGGFSNHRYCFNVPATALGQMGSAYMRFRLSTAGGLSPIGSAADGEVEDYVTPLGAIGNYVWVDENSDGYQDAGEPGLPNMRIWLRDSNGAIIGETWTDAHGGYLFPNLPPGSYLVDVDETSLPAGMTQTPFNLPGADFGNQDQSGLGYPVAIGGTQPLENLTADFGYNYNPTGDVDNPPSGATAALGDRVWIDVNGDGRQDPEEVGVREATVQLFTAGDDSLFGTADDVAGPTQTTDANGYYLFDDLQPGAYVVKVVSSASASHDVLGASYTQTGDPDHFGTTGSSNDNMTTTPVVLGPGDVFLNADFGYQPNAGVTLGTIGDTVWFDANASGTAAMDAGEYGIPGVTVALIRDTNGNGVWDAGEPVIAIDTTDASGQYLFSGLALSDDGDGDGADADYIVWVNDTDAVLTGLRQTYDQDAPLDNRSATALSAGTPQDLAQDFSYTAAGHTPATGLIGDTVWFDLNNSGGATQHAGEPGIEGVVMELVDGSGNVLATTTTDENGHYYFGGLPVSAGGIQYQVQVAASNFAAGGVLQGLAETYAAGGAVGGNQGNLVTLTTASPIDLAQDFSYTATIDPGRIGNLVWLDQNADGVFTTVDGPDGLPGTDDDEPALGDVTVDLYRDLNCNGRVDPVDPRLSTQTTASAIDAGLYGADGVYIFNRLATVGACGDNAAGYVVNVTDTAGLLAGYWHSLGTAGQDNHSQVDPYAAQISAAQVDNLTADFGYYVEPACVGNFVWYDQDGDSLQDVGELGLNGVTLQLAISWPAGGNTTLKVATGDNPKQSGTQAGWYSFCNLLQDEDYPIGSSTMAPATNQPAHVLSVASAPAGYAPTGIGGADSDEGTVPLDDSNNHAGTVGVPVHGLTDVSQQAAGSEPAIASYDFGYRDVQLAVLLASFDAVVQPDHVLVIWETVSEVNNAGFNLYRSLSADGEQVLLAFTPSAAPGSAAGAAYRLQDFAVQAGQAYWYWLEAVDLDGAPTRFDPASVTFQVPTAVTAGPLAADSGTANAAALPGVALALLLALAATTLLRRHQDAAP